MAQDTETRDQRGPDEEGAGKRPHVVTWLDGINVSLYSVIQMIDKIVEMNDLYTADHQRRVAVLAEAIAEEMHFPEDEIAAVYVAGRVHDIGKVYIPDEILNKPDELTDGEARIARNHAEVGHYMLEGLEFPWPVGEIVLQHHELLNGSGYPNGLWGEQILLSARVLAVADVVEAMCAPRPQRSALGLHTALKEVSSKRGLLYDAEVVDACVRLVRDKGFRFE